MTLRYHRVPMSDTRTRMIELGAILFRRRGYTATSLVDVVEEGGLPRGSLYHHFPDGKPQLAAEAIRHAALEVAKDMMDVAARASSAEEAVALYVGLLAERLERSGYEDGCWYAAMALEVAGSEPALAQALDAEFRHWEDSITHAFCAWGVAPDEAGPCAALVLAAVEGGLLRARLSRDVEHLVRLVPLLQRIVAGGASSVMPGGA